MSNLIETYTASEAKIITESKLDDNGKKHWYLEGIFVQGDVRNLNNRIYPTSEIKKAVDDINNRATDFTVWGELDHPAELQINLDRVSHLIEKMWMDGRNGMGRMKIINTMMGQTAQAMLDSGGKLGVSSRGSGGVNYDGIVEDYEIITVDIVATPSCSSARPVAIYEAFNGRGASKREDLIKSVQHDPAAQKYLHKELLNWLDSIK
jgi:hypothetical protein